MSIPEQSPIGPTEQIALAVDIGGTKLAVGVVDDRGRLTERHQRPTPRGDAEELFRSLVELLDDVGPTERFAVCGVGCGGPMTRGGESVSPLNIPSWRSFPLRARLASQTGLPTYVDNDAKALALAEGWVGAAVGSRNYLAMVVSTGVGGGIVLDGRLLEGSDGNAGHIGHVVVTDHGRPTDAEHVRGVLEAEASGTAIAANTGFPAADADPATVEATGRFVGRAVGSTANLLDLDFAVVAGSVALGFGDPFFAAAQREIDRICQLDFSRGMRIGPAGCGAEGPLVGAAAVGFRQLGLRIGLIEPATNDATRAR
ncbi:MAG: ROK family protein [Acidimicrobiales bacterium]